MILGEQQRRDAREGVPFYRLLVSIRENRLAMGYEPAADEFCATASTLALAA